MQKRCSGYKSAVAEAGYQQHILEGIGTAFEAGMQLGETLSASQIDAAFCTEDMLALGVHHALLEKGIRPGPDFGLVGFDNIQMSRYVFPELTTIDQKIAEKGEIATTTLLNILGGDAMQGTRLILPVQLIERDTTRR